MFQAVLFDWDGTLADTKAFVVAAFQRVLRKNGWEVDNELIERCMGIVSHDAKCPPLRWRTEPP